MCFSFTFFAFGEEARMIRNMGISTITICGLLAGCLSSSILITSEFERQTTLAVLSKPITRIHFILGKYLGVITASAALILFQGLVLETALMIHEYLKISNIEHHAHNQSVKSLIDYYCLLVDHYCLLGIYFSLLQIMILTAIAVIFSLYFNLTGTLIICFLIYIFCHTFSYIFPYHSRDLNIVSIMISICYVVFPNLHNLSMITINYPIFKPTYIDILYTSLYSIIYSVSVLWLATVCFKRKEIV